MNPVVRMPVLPLLPALALCACGAGEGGKADAGGPDAGSDTDSDTDSVTDSESDTEADVWKVRAGAAPGGDGLTWESAFADLQDALAAAWAGDEIWVAAGTYEPTSDGDRSLSFVMKEGAGIFGGFAGFEESRDERDWATNPTVLSGDIGAPGDDSDNSYHVVIGADGATLDGFTVTGGRAERDADAGQYGNGGGLLSEASTLVVANCTFVVNSAEWSGGAAYSAFGNLVVSNCAFSGNSAGGNGGGMAFIWGDIPKVTGCVFIGNTAGGGGGGLFDDGYFDTSKDSPRAGRPDSRGGAMVEHCVFAGNSAGTDGGGMANYYTSPAITNCVFTGNRAGGDGGGLSSYCGDSVITNCTFSGNEAASGGGVHHSHYDCAILNSIVWGNTAYVDGDSVSDNAGWFFFSHSCIEGGSWEWGEGVIDQDPLFAGAGDPAGPDGVWMTADDGLRLLAGSPCIDAANGDAAPESDIAGNARFDHPNALDTGSGEPPWADIGAYELAGWNGVWRVMAGAAPGGDGLSWETAFFDLQDALLSALPGEEIWVAAGTYLPDADGDRSVSFEMGEGVGIYGGFAGFEESRDERDWATNPTVLSGDIGAAGDDSDNSYHVVVGADGATLDGFTITGGRADGEGLDGMGGGMLNALAGPLVAHCVFDGNAAVLGGGMFNGGDAPLVFGCAFIGNAARYGGGMYDYESNPWIEGSVFAGNAADGGGGMLNHGKHPVIENCVLSGNTARFGGGMHNHGSGGPIIHNCTLAGNQVSHYGGGVSSQDADPSIENTVIRGNTAGQGGPSIFDNAAGTSADWSCIEGGWPGTGNFDQDPLFAGAGDPAGPDGVWMTADDGLRLLAGSPCIDAANGDAAPQQDILGGARFDCPEVQDTGSGTPPYADIGSYEYVP